MTTAATLEQTRFDLDPRERDEFRRKFEHAPFLFRHKLTSSELFQMPALRDLCRYCASGKGEYHFEMSEATAGDAFTPAPNRATLIDAFEGLGDRTLILLKKIHSHPEYGRLLQSVIEEVSDILGVSFHQRYRKPICTIVLASPNRVTQYHMDDAENLLMQVHGSKRFYVFDGNDREVLSARDLEEYWGAGNSRAARYSDAVQKKATLYDLTPGTGVHVPLTFPHWVLTDDKISVAVSINFQQISCKQSNIFRANYMLRKLGINPAEPGRHQAADAVKSTVMQMIVGANRLLRSRAPA